MNHIPVSRRGLTRLAPSTSTPSAPHLPQRTSAQAHCPTCHDAKREEAGVGGASPDHHRITVHVDSHRAPPGISAGVAPEALLASIVQGLGQQGKPDDSRDAVPDLDEARRRRRRWCHRLSAAASRRRRVPVQQGRVPPSTASLLAVGSRSALPASGTSSRRTLRRRRPACAEPEE